MHILDVVRVCSPLDALPAPGGYSRALGHFKVSPDGDVVPLTLHVVRAAQLWQSLNSRQVLGTPTLIQTEYGPRFEYQLWARSNGSERLGDKFPGAIEMHMTMAWFDIVPRRVLSPSSCRDQYWVPTGLHLVAVPAGDAAQDASAASASSSSSSAAAAASNSSSFESKAAAAPSIADRPPLPAELARGSCPQALTEALAISTQLAAIADNKSNALRIAQLLRERAQKLDSMGALEQVPLRGQKVKSSSVVCCRRLCLTTIASRAWSAAARSSRRARRPSAGCASGRCSTRASCTSA